jgi:TRAP-type mannitol/chloroaromatic compound transport system substrate-binding protein
MKRKITVATFVVGLSILLLIAPSAMAKSLVLNTALTYPSSLPILGETITYFSNKVKEVSDGQLIFKLFEPGKLVPAMEILEAVSKGRIQAGYSNPGFSAGKLPAGPLFSSIPFGPEAPEFLAWMYHGNGMKLYQEMYDRAGYKVKVFIVNMVPPETAGWFAKEIKSVDDLKGLKIRFFGLGGQVMQKLGAAVALTSAGEIFPALEKGALDATEFSMPLVDTRLGFSKICKYNYFPGWHQQATANEIIINKEVWEKKLTKSQRAIIETCAMATVVNMLALGEASQAKVMKENAEKHGVKNMYFSPQLISTFHKAWEEVAVEQAAKDPFFKKVYEDLQNFRKEYAYWAGYAFLPRESGAKPPQK